MKTNLKRVLSFVLVMMLILSCVPTMAFAAENSTAYAAQNITTGAEYDSLASAMEAAEAGQTVKALADCAEPVSYKDGVILDLNGHALTNVTVAADATVTAIDSATDDYKGSFGTLSGDIAGTVAATVKTAEPKTYISVCENGSWSFHRYYASITAISLKPASAALGYKAEFYGDEAVKNAVVSYGYELWVNNNAPKALSKSDKLEKNVLTLRLQNILKEGNAALNAAGSTATINGKAFITLNLNGKEVTLYGAEQSTTLRSTIEAINANVKAYSESALQAVRNLCTTYADWMNGWATENIFGINQGEGDLNVEITVPVTAENNVVTEAVVLRYEDIVATVPAGTQLTEGTTSLKLTIVDKNASDSGIAENEGETLRPLDIHIEGISKHNDAPVIIYLGQILPKALNIGNYELYHVEGEQTVPMTHVNASALDAHNEFTYDPATGAVTVAMASFSEIALTSVNENPWNGNTDTTWYSESETNYEIYNADQLAGLGELVDGGKTFEGKTVTMIGDIDLYGTTTATEDGEEVVIRRSFNPIGFGYSFNATGRVFKGIFDGNGNTIYNLYQNGWDLGYSYGAQGGGLFASIENATIKNLTMDHADIVMECVDMGTVVGYANGNCTFENIIIKNSTVQNYNRYTGGVIGEVGGGGIYTLNNVDVEKTTTLSALWGTFDPSVGGIIGGVWHEAGSHYGKDNTLTVTMTNCDVACKLDVYNDVTSAYQWYSYRRCGMLIGYTEESKNVEGRTEATAPFLTTKNCTVQYGDWVNYHYCEFTNTTSMDANYPWVRVEEGLSNGAYSNARYGVPTFNGAELSIESHREEADCHVADDGHDILIVFNQLYGGGQGCYGGNGHVGNGVTVLSENAIVLEPTTKFQSAGVESVLTGTTVTLGELFQAVKGAEIQSPYVYAFVSPVDAETSVRGTTAEPKANTDWQDLKITFSETGMAKVTINDYYYCQPTTIYVNVVEKAVAKLGETEYASVQHALNNANDGETVTLLDNVTVPDYLDIYTANNGETERTITLDLNGKAITPAEDYKYQYYPLVFVGINQTLNLKNGSIVADEHVALGVYGTVNLEDVTIESKKLSNGEQAVCIWNWGTDDEYYQDCQYLITGSADIKGGSITGGILVEGPVTLDENVQFDKLYLNTKTGHGKVDVPTGYGMVKQDGGYYNNLHKHTYENECCTVNGCTATSTYEKTDLSNIKSTDTVVITMTKDDTTYALPNNNGTQTPNAVVVEIDGNNLKYLPADSLLWNIGGNSDGYTFYPNGDIDSWLYCTNTNNGVRVGTNTNKNFTVSAGTEGNGTYLYNTATERYMGVYNAQDWRCYTATGEGQNIKDQILTFYVLKTNCNHANTEERAEIAATCTQAGHAAGTYCLDCDSYIEGGNLIDATGHAWGEYVVTKEPTCAVPGKAIAHCSVCNKATTKTLKIDHTEVIDEAVAATCTATGLTEGKHCSVCNTVIVAQTTVPMIDHNYANGNCTVCGAEDPDYEEPSVNEYAFIETALGDIKPTDIVVVTMTNASGTYAMSNDNSTGSAPSAVKVTVNGNQLSGNIVDTIKWNIGGNADNYIIYPNGSSSAWLYCTNTNNGVRVGTGNAKHFKINNGYLYTTETSEHRYIGVYNSADWRCYTSINNNITGQTLKFYVYKEVASDNGSGEGGESGGTEPTYGWVKVTDASTLAAGDKIVITNSSGTIAMSTTQNNNNRGATSFNAANPAATVQIITLENSTSNTGCFALNVDGNYLYCASTSSNNYLKTQSTINAAASWTISIANGNATITSKISNINRNKIYYNSNNTSIFACYSSQQTAISIYRWEIISE